MQPKGVLALILILSQLLCSIAYAQDNATEWETVKWCSSNYTLSKRVYRQVCIGGICDNVTRARFDYCDYGCNPNLNECNPNPLLRYLIVIIVVAIVGVILTKAMRWW